MKKKVESRKAKVERPVRATLVRTNRELRRKLEKAKSHLAAARRLYDETKDRFEKKDRDLREKLSKTRFYLGELTRGMAAGRPQTLPALDDVIARLRQEARTECPTALAFALTRFEEGREYLAWHRSKQPES